MEDTSKREREGRVIHPRLPDELHAELTAYAKANTRSVQNAVVHLLRLALQSESAGPRMGEPDVRLR